MKASTAIGLVGGLVAILLTGMLEGTSPATFINIPAIVIVLVGTFMATMASVGRSHAVESNRSTSVWARSRSRGASPFSA